MLVFLTTAIWGAAGGGSPFWPMWAWLGLAVLLALHAIARHALRYPHDPEAGFEGGIAGLAALGVLMLLIWAMSGREQFWPVWPLLAFAALAGAGASVHYRHRLPWRRSRHLSARVDELTRTRSGALDVQAAELRRIERDLHDGAQARLVALSMQLGRAEQRLAGTGDPATHALILGAQEEATAAIAELRDLSRGIAPPVLADRGLAAAADALGRRSPLEVEVDARLDARLLPVVESAAYFVIAEALTNAAKHAGGATVRITLRRAGDRLVVEIVDDGPGGADPDGSGLTGLRHRAEALDGTLVVHHGDPATGRGTVVRAELPCG